MTDNFTECTLETDSPWPGCDAKPHKQLFTVQTRASSLLQSFPREIIDITIYRYRIGCGFLSQPGQWLSAATVQQENNYKTSSKVGKVLLGVCPQRRGDAEGGVARWLDGYRGGTARGERECRVPTADSAASPATRQSPWWVCWYSTLLLPPLFRLQPTIPLYWNINVVTLKIGVVFCECWYWRSYSWLRLSHSSDGIERSQWSRGLIMSLW